MSISVSDVNSLRTISIHVVVAGVAFAVTISVSLVRILHFKTVVTRVAVAVFITVPLVDIGLITTVVLKQREHRGLICILSLYVCKYKCVFKVKEKKLQLYLTM